MSKTVTECPLAGGDSIARRTLCPLICACDKTPDSGAAGTNLKQQCVSKGLRALDKSLGHGSPVKAEVNYIMGDGENPPEPIMSGENPLKPSEWLPAHTRHIPGFEPGKGMVRRPDAVIVRNPDRPPTQDNLLEVVEIKFPPDTMSKAQRDAYNDIAGPKARLVELGPKECCCSDMERRPSPEVARKQVASKLEFVLLGLALAALVLDDLLPTGATQADDALIPGIVLRMMSAF